MFYRFTLKSKKKIRLGGKKLVLLIFCHTCIFVKLHRQSQNREFPCNIPHKTIVYTIFNSFQIFGYRRQSPNHCFFLLDWMINCFQHCERSLSRTFECFTIIAFAHTHRRDVDASCDGIQRTLGVPELLGEH